MSRLQGYNSFMFQLNRDTTKGLLTGILGRKTMRVGSNGRCFEQQPSCGQILQEGESFDRVLLYIGANVRQLSISGWCLIFMLGAILQVVATQDVAYIYGR
jgi:hypothetical protein